MFDLYPKSSSCWMQHEHPAVVFILFGSTPSLAAGRLECGWCEAVVLMPVGYGELLGGRRVELL